MLTNVLSPLVTPRSSGPMEARVPGVTGQKSATLEQTERVRFKNGLMQTISRIDSPEWQTVLGNLDHSSWSYMYLVDVMSPQDLETLITMATNRVRGENKGTWEGIDRVLVDRWDPGWDGIQRGFVIRENLATIKTVDLNRQRWFTHLPSPLDSNRSTFFRNLQLTWRTELAKFGGGYGEENIKIDRERLEQSSHQEKVGLIYLSLKTLGLYPWSLSEEQLIPKVFI